jgi:hypothetical protein
MQEDPKRPSKTLCSIDYQNEKKNNNNKNTIDQTPENDQPKCSETSPHASPLTHVHTTPNLETNPENDQLECNETSPHAPL